MPDMIGSARWMAASASAHCTSRSCPARIVELPLDAADDGLALDLVADQEWIAQSANRVVGDQDMGDRRAGSSGGGLSAGLELHAGVHVVRRAGAQDE